MFVHAIPQVTPERRGIHVLWAGPGAWLYSPAGWSIQRRAFERERPRLDCVRLSSADVQRLLARREMTIRHGVLTLRQGVWVTPLAPAGPAAAAGPVKCDVITLELAAPQSFVRVEVEASASFAVGLRDGKAVANGTIVPAQAAHQLAAPQIDSVVLYVLGLKTCGFCVQPEDAAGWRDVPVVKRLQLPIRELMPALAGADAELAEAKSRLLPGEALDRAEFEALTETLRRLATADGPPRPIDLALLMRERPREEAQELCALDPIRALLIHPRWRRILGFAWFDGDAALVPGQLYEYRVTGGFPAPDLDHRVAGFHTVPSGTALPAELYLGGVRLRLPQPRVIELARPDDGIARRQITRRGVRLAPRDEPWWSVPSLDDWSAVIDFPEPVLSVTLDVEPGHDLKFAFGAAWTTPSAAAALPPGPRARLDFGSPTHQLLLAGKGFLEAIRIPLPPPLTTGVEVRELAAVAGPIAFVDAPLPDPPLFAALRNLQQPRPVHTVDRPAAPTPHPDELGFEIRWRPAARPGVTAWPPDLPAPPLDAALFQVEHRQVAPTATAFAPIVDEVDNYTVGDRAHGAQAPPIHPGVDLMTVFPEVRPPVAGAFDLFWRDVFDFADDGGDSPDLPRPLPPPGTRHQYRVRAVDAIGRPSAAWIETGNERLEKHVPPPLPAAPDLISAGELPAPALTGVRARVLVPDAPDLTAEERAILAAHGSAIVLTWGWHDEQRRQDRYAREFRLYTSRRAPGRVRATILSVVPAGGDRFDAAISGDRAFAEDAARGSILEAGAQFRVLAHGAGPAATLQLRALERDAGGAYIAPPAGPIELAIRLTPEQTRAGFWGARAATEPIDGRTVYSHTFFDLFSLSPDQPREVIHVGVSAADGEEYVADPLAPASTRPGNESPIVAVRCEGRWYGRPVVVDVPSLAPVPVVVTPEPGARPMTFHLDLTPYSPFPPAAPVRPERVSDDAVFRAYRAESGRVIARVVPQAAPGDAEQKVAVPNAADRAAIAAALAGGAVSALEDRFVVFLAAAHPHRARLFQPATREPVGLDGFVETLPNRGARWVYRLRLADAAGRLSAEGATLPAVVRVPATTELAAPVRVERSAARIVLRVAATSEVTDLLVFTRALASPAAPREDAELLRVASSPGPAADRVRLRLPDGTLLVPAVKSLADADVVRDGPFRLVTVEAPPGGLTRVWACAATRDGVVSRPGGPWRVGEVTP
jgi:hypothetical protein